MKVLLTGATGFIGTNLICKLKEDGHRIGILIRSRSLEKRSILWDEVSAFHSDSFETIDSAIGEFKPDVIVHLAVLYINKHEHPDVKNLVESNITLGSLVLEAMVKNQIVNFLNIGTRWQHLDNERYNPANLYAATKEAFSVLVEYYGKQGIKYKTIELCDTFGKNDTRKKIVDLMTDACKSGIPIDLSPGEQILDLLYIEDLCNYLSSKISNNSFFDNSIISLSGTEIVLKDLGNIIEKIYNVNGCLNWGGKPYRDNEVMIPPRFFPIEKILSTTIEDALRQIKVWKDENI